MPTVDVKPELIQWAIDRSGVPLEELAKPFPKLDQWLTGQRDPTFRQLENFARRTMTPLGLLLLNEPPDEKLDIPDFRTLGDTPIRRPSPNLLDTMHEIRRRQAFVRDVRIEDGQPPLEFVGIASDAQSEKSLAQRIRRRLRLPANWAESLATWEDALQTLRQAAEEIGLLVFSNGVVGLNNHRPLDPEEFRGFVLCDPIAPAVFLNDADTKSARMFTLAHELVHVWIGRDALVNLIDLMPAHNEQEQFCNRVAAEFLVPAYKLHERWEEAASRPRPFETLARWFKVSPVVTARRALDLGLISKPEFFQFYRADRADYFKRKKDERKKPGGNFYATQANRLGRAFSRTLVRTVREGRISYQDAHRLTGLKGETFTKFADRILDAPRMSGSKVKYLLDANPFIEAKNRYYGFDICPGFWKALVAHHQGTRVFSIDRIKDELTAQQDVLSDWVQNVCPESFFKKTEDQAVFDAFQLMINWVYAEPFSTEARTEFASVADGWVIAFAFVNSMTVVTHEEYAPDAKKRVPMPNVCLEFDVPYVNTFEMLKELGVELILKTKRRRKR